MKHLWKYLLQTGTKLVWLGQHETQVGEYVLPKGKVEDCDVVFFYWRWQMHESYTERNEAYDNQLKLIQECKDKKVPYIAWDGDHKMNELEIIAMKADPLCTLASPELAPRDGFKSVMYPNPYLMINPLVNRMPFFGEWDMIYIGNNYERWDQWLEYVAKPSNLGMKIRCFGNWLEPHPDRQAPEEVKKAAPSIDFPGRLIQPMIKQTYMIADCTVHLTKPSYCKTGFVTMRWAEAAAAATLGWIPGEFQHVPPALEACVVDDGADLVKKHRGLNDADWMALVHTQQQWVTENMTLQGWVDMLEWAAGRNDA